MHFVSYGVHDFNNDIVIYYNSVYTPVLELCPLEMLNINVAEN
jgi:hypothetical protein